MEITLPALRRDEEVSLALRALYEQRGYQLYRMGSFEEYDLYMQNKSFLKGDDIITFTGVDGRLMALKPDVTLSIVKNTPAGSTRQVYYIESVFRRSRQTGEYREINQMGVEFIGGDGPEAEAEVLRLAAESLGVIGRYALDLSHMEFIEVLLAPLGSGEARQMALDALQCKSPHGMRDAARLAGLDEAAAAKLAALAEISGPFAATLPKARALAGNDEAANRPLDELEELYRVLEASGDAESLRLDFSILNDIDYYNGLIFQGYVNGAPGSILAGGRYDNLLRRFGKPQGAIGFGLHLDEIGRPSPLCAAPQEGDSFLNVALPKGRMGEKVYKLFAEAGFPCEDILKESRKLVFEDKESRVRYFLVKPSDVDIYVEHGAADIGVVGRDVMLESGADVLDLLDLGLGRCRLAVAGQNGFVEDPALPLRVATKYPRVARRYYAAHSRSVEIIKLHGSIELAPLLGLSDVIVDIVETGSTLKENNLSVFAEIAPSTARLIANRASWRFKQDIIRRLATRLEELI